MSSQWGNLIKMGMLQAGKTVKFSRADLLNYTINLLDVKKKVSSDQYNKIYDLFLEISKDKVKVEMDLTKYKATINEITERFVAIAPEELSQMISEDKDK